MYKNFINKMQKSKWRTTIMLLLPMFFLTVGLSAQNLNIKGRVIDQEGNVLPGTAVRIKGTTIGSATNDDGDYVLNNVPVGSALEFVLVGYVTQEVKVGGDKTIINAIMAEEAQALDDVVVMAFSTQKRESVIASVSTINTKELKIPSSNLTSALAGRIAGLISYQRTGEPGADNAEFFIRGVTSFGTGKKDPLILIDGVEMTNDDLARLIVDDIASFSIMKDANATALYGARGANGVILVTTKEGSEGKMKIQFRAEVSHSSPTRTMDYADPVTYMQLHNEAIRTRDKMAGLMYSSEKIYNTAQGRDPLRYPALNWEEMLFNDYTVNQRYNLNVSGGGKIARYYVAASYSRDNGIVKMDKRNNFNNNIQIDRYVLRSNVNINLSKTTEVIVRLHGAFDDYSGPLDDGTGLYTKALNSNPVLFQPYYEPDYEHRGAKHILFGNYGTGNYLNPYSEMVKGFKTKDRTDMLAQFEVKQNLNFITEGLSVRALFNVNRYSLLTLTQSYIPFFYSLIPSDVSDENTLYALNPNGGRETLDLTSSDRELTSSMYFETAVQYSKTFADKHDVSALLVYTIRESLNGNPSNLQNSLAGRNLGLAGRLTYGYDKRYFIEGNFGYNGSERFAKNERFGFFPSVGLGWIVSNESFMKPFNKTLSKLKLKATYGLVGNDAIGSDRFFYMANVNVNDGGRGFTMGYDWQNSANGISISHYANPYITWEVSRKTNLGIELNLWKSLEIQVDWFKEKRDKILQRRSNIPTTMGLQETPSSNIGKAGGGGVDMSIDYNKSFTKDLWMVLRGNFTYASSKYEYYEEPDYSDTPWLSMTGQKISQERGFVAERLFLDEYEVANSPRQFGDYKAGDIKYKDIDGNRVIDGNDKVPIGYPKTPEINYGFGLSLGFQNLDFSCFWQGSARSAFWISPGSTAPFVSGAISGFATNRALLQYWADDHWSETDKNVYALWPRLSPSSIENNEHVSTWWMRDGSFLRLKTAEIGYTLPHKWINRLKMQNLRVYLNGSNLFVLSAFKMWDPEMAGNGVSYPLQRVINVGINVEF